MVATRILLDVSEKTEYFKAVYLRRNSSAFHDSGTITNIKSILPVSPTFLWVARTGQVKKNQDNYADHVPFLEKLVLVNFLSKKDLGLLWK